MNVEEAMNEVEKAMNEVEEAKNEVEEALDKVEEALDVVEEAKDDFGDTFPLILDHVGFWEGLELVFCHGAG